MPASWTRHTPNLPLPRVVKHIQTALSGPLNETTLVGLDNLVDIITGNGRTVILKLHNYARYDCAVIGQPLLNLPGTPPVRNR
ncbi:hypothetical protein BJX96DRAFT_33599 [Aspergillus floccosus]